jgi:hypothetical protein
LEEILVRVEPAEDDEPDEKWWIETMGKGNRVMISIATALGWFPDPSQLWLTVSFVLIRISICTYQNEMLYANFT